MKIFQAVCLLVCTPALALAQATPPPDESSKPQPLYPIVAKEHAGPGRIGVRLVWDKATGLPYIAAMTRGGPAADFGFEVGDIIIKIDKNYTSTLSDEDARLALHGEPGSAVELTVQRGDNPKLIIRSLERRVPAPNADGDDMVNPPMDETAKP
jgi:C-terminal processing protease CtpA/Prc